MSFGGALLSHANGFSRGLSLVELMVANLLGLMLLAAISGLYLAGKRQYLYDEQVARLQENGRYAVALLRRELAMAGFYGGMLTTGELVPLAFTGDCGAPTWALDASLPLAFTDDHEATPAIQTTTGVTLTCINGADVAPSTDLLAIRRTAAQAVVAEGFLSPDFSSYSGRRWYLRHSPGGSTGWHALTSDEVLQTAVNSEPVNIWKAVAKIFYVRNYSDAGNREDDLPALCVEELVKEAMRTRCLVEGVENVQLELGMDTDGDGVVNRYMSPGEVADMADAVSARVYVLLRSVYRVAAARGSSTFRLGRRVITKPRDGYLRRVFSTTVLLRNAAPRPIPVAPGDHDAAA